MGAEGEGYLASLTPAPEMTCLNPGNFPGDSGVRETGYKSQFCQCWSHPTFLSLYFLIDKMGELNLSLTCSLHLQILPIAPSPVVWSEPHFSPSHCGFDSIDLPLPQTVTNQAPENGLKWSGRDSYFFAKGFLKEHQLVSGHLPAVLKDPTRERSPHSSSCLHFSVTEVISAHAGLSWVSSLPSKRTQSYRQGLSLSYRNQNLTKSESLCDRNRGTGKPRFPSCLQKLPEGLECTSKIKGHCAAPSPLGESVLLSSSF